MIYKACNQLFSCGRLLSLSPDCPFIGCYLIKMDKNSCLSAGGTGKGNRGWETICFFVVCFFLSVMGITKKKMPTLIFVKLVRLQSNLVR